MTYRIFLFISIFCLLIFGANPLKAQEICGTDLIHQQLMATDSAYATFHKDMNRRIKARIEQKALDLDNSTLVTIPVVVHIMHKGGAIGTNYNPSEAAINSMMDELNDFYSNANGNGVDVDVQFELASRDPNCSATTGIIRVDASVVTDYTTYGLDLTLGSGASELDIKNLSRWSNLDYYNIWIVSEIDDKDGYPGTMGFFITGFAYFPGASATVDGTMMLASRVAPGITTLTHELGHALNLYHVFNGDAGGASCPANADCTTDGDRVCDTDPQIRNASTCPSDASINVCTGNAWNGDQRNLMDYSSCRDRFTSGQRDRMRAALEVSRPGLVVSKGHEAPPATTAASACTPGVINVGNFGMGPLQVDFADERSWTPSQSSAGEYLDHSCSQVFTAYPGQQVSMSVGTASNSQLVRVYIDYNDNGTLNNGGELVFSSNTAGSPQTHSGIVSIPVGQTIHTPVRMRIWADWISSGTTGPCGNLAYGQAVDYSVIIEDVDVWTGTTSTDWSVTTNWAKGSVPTSSGNVRIPSSASNQPRVTAAAGTPAVCANLEIQSGATLTINAGRALTASGITTNNGTMLIQADATGIGSFIDNGTLAGSGSYQMEQYLAGSGGATPNGLFWYVSSPMAAATSNVYNAAGTDRLWNAVESSQSYPGISDNVTSLNVTKGYVARMGASGSVTFSGGNFNTGNISASGLTRTGASVTNRGYNLVGNPYPSTVSWDGATRTNLQTTLWYRTHQGTTMLFDTYNASGSIGTNNNGNGAVTGGIPPTQAFWVRVPTDGQTGQLDFTNADRSHGTLASIYKVSAEEGLVRMTLSNATLSDETILLFNADAFDGYDDFDSQKFWAGASVPQIYTTLGSDTLVINGMYSTTTNPVVDLVVKLPSQGEYTLNANSITIVGETVHLEDKMLNVFQDLNTEPVYTFTSGAGNIADRFALHFNASITGLEEAENDIRVYASQNVINVILSESTTGTIRVLDMTGRVVLTQNITSDRTTIDLNQAAGIYVVEVQTATETISRKVIGY